jgi:hypothetical protein
MFKLLDLFSLLFLLSIEERDVVKSLILVADLIFLLGFVHIFALYI